MSQFYWFVFRPLTIEEFIANFSENRQRIEQWFEWWNDYYRVAARAFYRSQYDRHLTMVFREFSREHYLDAEYPSDLWDVSESELYRELWSQWKESATELTHHHQTIEPLISDPSPKTGLTLTTAGDLLRLRAQMISLGWNDEQQQKVKALWFNSNVPVSLPAEVQALRVMPYREYLKTRHWYKVRAAMLLIQRAMCKKCGHIGESFYGGGWESEVHVHHNDYANRGCERYEDLELLCRYHHEQHHNRG